MDMYGNERKTNQNKIWSKNKIDHTIFTYESCFTAHLSCNSEFQFTVTIRKGKEKKRKHIEALMWLDTVS